MFTPRRRLWLLAGLAAPVLALPALMTPAAATTTAPYANTTISLVSRATGTAQANFTSFAPAVSGSGRYVAFTSVATNLAPGDDGGMDVFVRDRLAGRTTRVSTGRGGAQPNGESLYPDVSADGRYVAFVSWASNLVAGDTNDVQDIFVRDLVARTTTRVSVTSTGGQADASSYLPRITADGRQVAFDSEAALVRADTNPFGTDVYVHNLATKRTSLMSVSSTEEQAERGARHADISADGRFVTFSSDSPNLVPDRCCWEEVFVRDRTLGTTRRVLSGVPDGQSQESRISRNGRYVAFWSDATNLVAGDTNGARDVFVADLTTGTITRASVSSSEVQGALESGDPEISDSGRYVAFVSSSNNLVRGDTSAVLDVFVRDRAAGTTHRASTGVGGADANGNSALGGFSADGHHLTFSSGATNLVRSDRNGNGNGDVFVRDTFGDLS